MNYSQIWEVEEKDSLAGFARICEKRRDDTPDRQRYAKLNDLFIEPAARRSGLAHILLAAAQTWAVERGLPSITLKVYQANSAAKILYEHLGYQEVRRVSGDRVMMSKDLSTRRN